MQIEYNLTNEDLIEYYIYTMRFSKQRRKRNWLILAGIVIMPFLLSGPSIYHGNSLYVYQYWIFVLALTLLIFFPIYWRMEPRIYARRAVRYYTGTKVDPTGPVKLRFNEYRIEYETSSAGGWENWDSISSIGVIENHFLISIRAEVTFIIPLRAFENRQEFERFAMQVNELRNANPNYEQVCPKCKYDLTGSESVGCPECGWQREE